MGTSNGYGEWVSGHDEFLARVRGRVERVLSRTERDADGIDYEVYVSDPDAGHTRERDEDMRCVWSYRMEFGRGRRDWMHQAVEGAREQERIADEIIARYLVGAVS